MKNIYESKQDNWHPVVIRRSAATDLADCFGDVFVWQYEYGDASIAPALPQTHITPKGTPQIRPCMFLVQSNILQYCCKSSRLPNTSKK
jgi:hypothetical protein